MDIAFQAELEEVFKQNFLEHAPLYVAAPKVKLPYEDIKKSTTLYRGSLSEQVRVVDEIADYHIFENGWPGPEGVKEKTRELARNAALCVEGLIRVENRRNDPDHDVRSPHIRVIDVFEYADGRRNFQPFYVKASEQISQGPSWIAYRFCFAAANVRTEYKPASSGLTQHPN
jgi:hypothetical protein